MTEPQRVSLDDDKQTLIEQIAERRTTFTPEIHGVPTGTDARLEPRVYWRDGRPRWFHTCLLGGLDAGLDNVRWSWNQETDSVSPSLSCSACGTHGFWTNGAWRDV